MVDKDKVREGITLLLEGIGEDPLREGLIDTPDRVARMYEELCQGMEEDPGEQLSKAFHAENNEMILEKDITFYSICEHHLMPFYGKAPYCLYSGWKSGRDQQAGKNCRGLCKKTADPGKADS